MSGVKLEFLRHGPPHNQLLSPLTQYFAICGEHACATVSVPFEHAPLSAQLRLLGSTSRVDPRTRQAQLDQLSEAMGRVLGQVPALIAELGCATGAAGVLHLRLVLSANELALLPFELASGATGMPGTGQHLLLQSSKPICITREIRNIDGARVEWPRRGRILLAAASPPDVPPVPIEAHLLALRQAVEPWVQAPSGGDAASAVGEHLELLLDASPRRLAEAIARGKFTHVHLLAHGAAFKKGDDRRFGIALHDDADPGRMDVLDGERLAAVLRPHEEHGKRSLASPTVVTLATCDSGNVGGVIGNGASLAHELHRAGIPLVVASQFPLSYPGSVLVARLLYGPLLAGEHPCLVLDDVRRSLRTLPNELLDWIGLVVYAALPEDLPRQLVEVRYARGRAMIEAAMSYLDALGRELCEVEGEERVPERPMEAIARDLERAQLRFREARDLLCALMQDAPDHASAIHGLLAGAEKRAADTLWRSHRRARQSKNEGVRLAAVPAPADEANRASVQKEASEAEPWRENLARAEDHYQACFESDRGASWALVQQMALRLRRVERIERADWELARALSEVDTSALSEDRRVWALANLVELAVQGLLLDRARGKDGSAPAPSVKPSPRAGTRGSRSSRASWVDAMGELGASNVSRLLAERAPDDLVVRSLRRQLLRYDDGFLHEETEPDGVEAATLAKKLFGLLDPDSVGRT